MINTHGGTVQPESVETLVVYDIELGQIHHVHQFITFKGGAKVNHPEAESLALSAAKARTLYAGNLKVLHVPHGALQPGVIYSVDLKTLSLVAKERPRPARPKQ
jgi:hypothetical protein